MKRLFLMGAVFALLCACSEPEPLPDNSTAETTVQESTPDAVSSVQNGYTSISGERARELIDENPDCVILDVRTDEEFNEGHIPGAVLIPNYDIEKRAEEMLPDKNALILVYCRTGRRSKVASAALAEMGYTNVWEFGGIENWGYETTIEQEKS